jgi:addiction module RelE/StbE family toxin
MKLEYKICFQLFQPIDLNVILSVFHVYKNIDEVETIVNIIAARDILPPSNRDHTLTGNYSENRECHIEPDWLLIYRVDEDDETTLQLA